MEKIPDRGISVPVDQHQLDTPLGEYEYWVFCKSSLINIIFYCFFFVESTFKFYQKYFRILEVLKQLVGKLSI